MNKVFKIFAVFLASISVFALIYMVDRWRTSCAYFKGIEYLRLIGSSSRCDGDSIYEALWISVKDRDEAYKYFIYHPRSLSGNKKIIVRIPGGPGDSTHLPWDRDKPNYLRWLKDAAETCNAPIVNMSYSGTASRQSWPHEGAPIAESDIYKWLGEINQAYGAENVLIISESLGPYFLFSSGTNLHKNRMMLVEPLAVSPNEWIRNLQKERKEGFVLTREKYHRVKVRESDFNWVKLDSDEILSAYFDKMSPKNDRNLVSFLDSPPYNNIYIIYSRRDWVGSGDFDKYFHYAGIKFSALDGLIHGLPLEGGDFDRKIEILYKWLGEVCP